MTEQERKLWYEFLRTYEPRFYRQKVLGKYIADFYCSKAKLVIELDGSQHYTSKGMLKDNIRTSFLNEYDLLVIRVPNNYVNESFYEVCTYIDNIVKSRYNPE